MTPQRSTDSIEVGQVWCDTDPRGGPTFRIVDLNETHAVVTDLDGNRRRRIQRKRLPRNYRPVWSVPPLPCDGSGGAP